MLFSKKETAEKLKISTKTLERLMAAKAIGFVQVGRLIHFSQENLDCFIQKNSHPALGEGGAA
jgi:excisionase family DNA binding protein